MKNKIENIFSKKTLKLKEEPKIKIIIDYREKNCLVASNLVKQGFEIEFKELKVADYIVKDVAIERKTVSDFHSSMINRHLVKQLEELKQYENRLLIIEGIEEQELYNDYNYSGINNSYAISSEAFGNRRSEFRGKSKKTSGLSSNAIRGFLLSIVLKHKVPIIFTKNSQDTAKFISILSKKKEKEMPLNVNKKTFNKKERLQFILESFPGIGPKTAKKLLEKFKSIKNITNAEEGELQKILGKKAQIIKNLIEEEY